MNWTKGLLIVSLVVFFMAVFYAAVTFYRLRQPSEPEVVYTAPEEPSVSLRKNPQVSKTSEAPDEFQSFVGFGNRPAALIHV